MSLPDADCAPLDELEALRRLTLACGDCDLLDDDACCALAGMRAAGWAVNLSVADDEIVITLKKRG